MNKTKEEFLKRYAAGERNFAEVDLSGVDLNPYSADVAENFLSVVKTESQIFFI